MTDTPPAIPAATLVVFRDAGGGAPELLFVERAKAMAFAGGALVFPGGRVDPGDHALAAMLGKDDSESAARIAAVRETIEEAGLPIGLSPMPSPSAFERLRAALHDGLAFGAALTDADVSLDLDVLEYFARWRPAHAHARIFDTRFYLARLPAGAPEPRVDATENVRLFWTTAATVLAEADAGRATIIFPTRRNLERLAQFATFDAAVAHARAHPVRTVTPWTEVRDGIEHLCIPHDLGYPVTSEPLLDAVRG
ncbi:NUDIX hydrolase [Sphingomonas sp. Leaf38]|jgi:8-oxo-dGTP pyrophosphatase MutT (NUDIX family)|uniref:NUDIX hydrolase n=1 Tax=Sphingomonas sp. Leaf38 TaxID=1736217 RepID=UPI0006F4FED9|nr:NUDIX domain-containing protein [Sphingomonas sp. Leaf38]KQN29673.1 NUDIX hydrolase [Sphingomonas sp. Leaf38]